MKRREIRIAEGAGTTVARGSYVWWSTGANAAVRWHLLDLTAL